MTDEQMAALEGDYLNSTLFTDEEKAAMHWAEVLTEKTYQGAPGRPPNSHTVMEKLKQYYNEAQIVEITMVSGFFNFWNRFTDALEVDIETGALMDSFSRSLKINPSDYVAFMRECWWNGSEFESNNGD